MSSDNRPAPTGGAMIGVDIGGTFTDIVVGWNGTMVTTKAPSTRGRAADGLIDGLRKAAAALGLDLGELLRQTERFAHGTTVAINAVLERRGEPAALITTRGFRDTLGIRRMYRDNIFDLQLDPPEPLIPRDRIFEVRERVDRAGKVVEPLDEAEVEAAIQAIRELGVRTVGVCFLFSFRNTVHERRVAELVRAALPDCAVALSSEVCPEIRDYERTSTVAMEAYLRPIVARHLDQLADRLAGEGLRGQFQVMQSNGGLVSPERLKSRVVSTINSGPAAGVIAGLRIGQELGIQNLITLDMGGTSFDACLINDGAYEVASVTKVTRWDVMVPMINVHSIGAGGGSIAWVDDAGGLHVGPQSAGANPGPACYGLGGREPTATDAGLLLGYLNPDYFLGGDMRLDAAAARTAVGGLAARLGRSAESTADAIFRIVNNNMLDCIRVVSVQKGHDPRDFTLLLLGGAAPVHVPAMVAELGVTRLVVPQAASVLSAYGLLQADFRADYVQTCNRPLEEIVASLESVFGTLERRATDDLVAEGFRPEDVAHERFGELKYVGQAHEVALPLAPPYDVAALGEQFDAAHERLNGFKRPGRAIHLMNARLSAAGRTRKPALTAEPLGPGDPEPARKGTRPAYFFELERFESTPVYDDQRLRPGNRIAGPAIIERPDTAIVVRPGQTARIDGYRNCVIEATTDDG